MKTIDIRSKSDDDLRAELVSLKEQMFRLRFQHATAQLENHRKLRLMKKDIARLNTVVRERAIRSLNDSNAASNIENAD